MDPSSFQEGGDDAPQNNDHSIPRESSSESLPMDMDVSVGDAPLQENLQPNFHSSAVTGTSPRVTELTEENEESQTEFHHNNDFMEVDGPVSPCDAKEKFDNHQFGSLDFDGSSPTIKDENSDTEMHENAIHLLVPSLSARKGGIRPFMGGLDNTDDNEDDHDYEPHPNGHGGHYKKQKTRAKQNKTQQSPATKVTRPTEDRLPETRMTEKPVGQDLSDKTSGLLNKLLKAMDDHKSYTTIMRTRKLNLIEKCQRNKIECLIADLQYQLESEGVHIGAVGISSDEKKNTKKSQAGGSRHIGPKARPSKKLPANAEEWWRAHYKKGDDTPKLLTRFAGHEKKRRENTGGMSRAKRQKVNSGQLDFMDILRNEDQIMARALQGDSPIPGALVDRNESTKKGLMKQLQSSIKNAPKGKKREMSQDKATLEQAISSFGYKQCKFEDGKYGVPGIKTLLYPHQLIGVSWALGREFSPDGPFGGILADDMGLGKTLQILAVTMNNQSGHENGPTLIVGRASSLIQWEEEIQKHTNLKLVLPYRKKNSLEVLKSADLVLASYEEIANDYPSQRDLLRIADLKIDKKKYKKEFDNILGDIFRIAFRRVVLDEAHHIKNRDSKTSKACRHLSAPLRWAVTGTPMQNRVDEIYPYLEFIGIKGCQDFSEFRETFGKCDEKEGYHALNEVLPHIIIRRLSSEKFLGAPLLDIPAPFPTENIETPQSDEERFFYRRCEDMFRDHLSRELAFAERGPSQETATNPGQGEDKPRKKSYQYFAHLTYLRMLTSHPFNGENLMVNYMGLEDIRHVMNQLSESGGKRPVIDQIEQIITQVSRKNSRGDGAQRKTLGSGTNSQTFDIHGALDGIAAGKQIEEVFCWFCEGLPETAVMNRCGHAFCTDCVKGAREDAEYHGDKYPKCPSCGDPIRASGLKPFNIHQFASQTPQDEPSDPPMPHGRENSRRKQKSRARRLSDKDVIEEAEDRKFGEDYKGKEPVSKSRKFLNYIDATPLEPVPPSAKTTIAMERIEQWQREAPEDKIILFTQFCSLMCILGRMLNQRGIDWVYFWGGLDATEKHEAVKVFDTVPQVKVMIANIVCGGQALNLTVANRAICFDLAWNEEMERQAFGRIHRLGQTKRTHFLRIIAKNTIDTRIIELQKRKSKEIEKAFARKTRSYTDDDMKFLLGNVTRNTDGTTLIEADYDEDEDDDKPSDQVADVGGDVD